MLQLEREAGGTALHGMSWNMWVSGGSGTGKTKFTKSILPRYLRAYGAIDKELVVETTGQDLVSAGKSPAEALKQAFAEASGGILLIDDAHNLVAADPTVDDTSVRVTSVLLTEIQRSLGQTVVVLAGHKEGLTKFMASNYGLESRFSYHVHIQDYNMKDLVQIMEQHAQGGGCTFEGGSPRLCTCLLACLRTGPIFVPVSVTFSIPVSISICVPGRSASQAREASHRVD